MLFLKIVCKNHFILKKNIYAKVFYEHTNLEFNELILCNTMATKSDIFVASFLVIQIHS